MPFRPMLAAKDGTPEMMQYPMIASPKLDGVRAIVIDGVLMSRSMKPIPNWHTQNLFAHEKYNGLDGELMVGDPRGPTVFRDTMSAVMSYGGEPQVKFCVFDWFHRQMNFLGRLHTSKIVMADNPHMTPVPQVTCYSLEDAVGMEALWLAEGYEGMMLRSPGGLYKQGRSTLNERGLVKIKRFQDGEATVTGFIELEHNLNEAKPDERGFMKRSSHQENKVPGGKLGALSVVDKTTGVTFEIGTGYTDGDRQAFWNQREELVGKLVKYRFFPTGSKDKPRFPIFAGFRDPLDLSA